jgi:hypothetical protein
LAGRKFRSGAAGHTRPEYPAEARRAFDGAVARMARALNRAVNEDCDEPIGQSTKLP